MHPPFFHVDHKVDAFTHSVPAKCKPRRTQPARLAMQQTSHVFAPVPMRADPPPPLIFAPGPVRLSIVPPPQASLRDRIGRFLIRTGQRMIFQNHARGV